MVQNDKMSVALHIWGTIPHMSVIYICKMIISSGFFSIVLKILIFWMHRWVKGQKTMSSALHIWGTIHHMTVIYICKMIISSGVFFIFIEILIFWVHREVKGQKTVQNDKKFCLSHSISQEPYYFFGFRKKLTINVSKLAFWKYHHFKHLKSLYHKRYQRYVFSIYLLHKIHWQHFLVYFVSFFFKYWKQHAMIFNLPCDIVLLRQFLMRVDCSIRTFIAGDTKILKKLFLSRNLFVHQYCFLYNLLVQILHQHCFSYNLLLEIWFFSLLSANLVFKIRSCVDNL